MYKMFHLKPFSLCSFVGSCWIKGVKYVAVLGWFLGETLAVVEGQSCAVNEKTSLNECYRPEKMSDSEHLKYDLRPNAHLWSEGLLCVSERERGGGGRKKLKQKGEVIRMPLEMVRGL